MANTKIQSEQIADDVALAGSPTTTTQSASDNSTKVATTAYVTTAVANLVDSAPSSLNTLNELAAAMNDNASFFSTVLPLSGGTMTGNISHASSFALDVGGNITLDADGGQVEYKDDGTLKALIDFTGNNVEIQSRVTDADLLFRGQDGSSFITALTLDMSEAGAASFNSSVTSQAIIATNASGTPSTFNGADNNNTLQVFAGTTSNQSFGLLVDAGTSSSDYAAEFRKADNTTIMRIRGDGNVGIGTNSPAALIHGMAGDLFLTANSTSADSGQAVYFQSTTSGWTTSSAHAAIFGKRTDASNGYLRFDTRQSGTTQEAMRIDSSGNILLSSTLISSNTSDGSDNKSIMINGGGAASDTRGGYVIVHGNEHSSNAGITRIHAGNVGTADIQFYTGGHQRAQIDSNGNLILKKNLVLESTSEGIDFSGVGSSANTLDDYEEGTWTLALNTSNSDAVITITNTTGSYTKIGDVVHVRIYTAACGVGSAGSGTVYISGLPFTVANTGGNRNYSAASFAHTNIFSTSYEAYGAISHSFAVVVQEGSISSATFATGNGKYMMFSLTYRTTQ